MIYLSEEFELEVERRLADGSFPSAEDLLRHALHAMDEVELDVQPWMADEIRKGMTGNTVTLTAEDLLRIAE